MRYDPIFINIETIFGVNSRKKKVRDHDRPSILKIIKIIARIPYVPQVTVKFLLRKKLWSRGNNKNFVVRLEEDS